MTKRRVIKGRFKQETELRFLRIKYEPHPNHAQFSSFSHFNIFMKRGCSFKKWPWFGISQIFECECFILLNLCNQDHVYTNYLAILFVLAEKIEALNVSKSGRNLYPIYMTILNFCQRISNFCQRIVSNLNVSRVSGNIEILGKTKFTISRGSIH